jgi:hypothetical protein
MMSDFRTRQRVMMVLAGGVLIFLIFYWTHMLEARKIQSLEASIAATYARTDEVIGYAAQIKFNERSTASLSTGLLSYIQNMPGRLPIAGQIINLRMVAQSGTANRQEQVSFRTENLVYKEFLDILADLERYDNVWVKSMTLTKRFDNPMHIDIGWEVVRGL